MQVARSLIFAVAFGFVSLRPHNSPAIDFDNPYFTVTWQQIHNNVCGYEPEKTEASFCHAINEQSFNGRLY